MALVAGTKTSTISLACSPIGTISHSHNVGANGKLIVLIAHQTGSGVSSITYGGQAMTMYDSLSGGSSLLVKMAYLDNPPTGANNIVVTMGGSFNVGFMARSFTGAASGNLNYVSGSLANTPNSQSITILANSMIMAWSQSIYSFDTTAAITIDGVGTGFSSCDVSGAVYTYQWCAHLRNANLSAGSKTVTTDTIFDTYQATNYRIEIKEAAVAPTTRRIFLVT